MSRKAHCPICDKPVESPDYRPFCSRRCADVDLSRWLKGGYAIPGAPSDSAEQTPGRPAHGEE